MGQLYALDHLKLALEVQKNNHKRRRRCQGRYGPLPQHLHLSSSSGRWLFHPLGRHVRSVACIIKGPVGRAGTRLRLSLTPRGRRLAQALEAACTAAACEASVLRISSKRRHFWSDAMVPSSGNPGIASSQHGTADLIGPTPSAQHESAAQDSPAREHKQQQRVCCQVPPRQQLRTQRLQQAARLLQQYSAQQGLEHEQQQQQQQHEQAQVQVQNGKGEDCNTQGIEEQQQQGGAERHHSTGHEQHHEQQQQGGAEHHHSTGREQHHEQQQQGGAEHHHSTGHEQHHEQQHTSMTQPTLPPSQPGVNTAEQLVQQLERLALQQQHVNANKQQQQKEQQQVVEAEQAPAVPAMCARGCAAPSMEVPLGVVNSRPPSVLSASGHSWAQLAAQLAAVGVGKPVAQLQRGLGLLQVSRADFDRLRPAAWLNDELVNFYLSMVQARTDTVMQQQRHLAAALPVEGPSSLPAELQRLLAVPRSYIFSSFFYELLVHGPSRGYNYAAVQRWTLAKKTRTSECVLSWDLLLFPINLNNTHWAVAAVWPQRGLLQYYDSMNGSGSGSSILGHLATWLSEDADDKGTAMPWAPKELRCVNVRQGMPQQADGSSCGLFACTVCERLAAGWGAPFHFSQADVPSLRLGMAYDILRGQIA